MRCSSEAALPPSPVPEVPLLVDRVTVLVPCLPLEEQATADSRRGLIRCFPFLEFSTGTAVEERVLGFGKELDEDESRQLRIKILDA